MVALQKFMFLSSESLLSFSASQQIPLHLRQVFEVKTILRVEKTIGTVQTIDDHSSFRRVVNWSLNISPPTGLAQ